MIVCEKRNKPKNLYGDYFLAVEAPGDENETPRPRNTKVINIKTNNRGKDYAAGVDDDMNDAPADTPADTTAQPTEPATTDVAAPADNAAPTPQPMENPDAGVTLTTPDGTTNMPTYDAPDNTDFSAGVDAPATDTPDVAAPAPDPNADPNATGDVTPGTAGDGTADVTVGNGDDDNFVDDTDYTAGVDGGDVGGAADAAADPNAAGTGDESKAPAVSADSMRKYNLFKEYTKLLNAIDRYIEVLDSQVVDDVSYNKAIRIATEKLKEIKNQCYDYLLLKFELDSYGKNLVFQQKIVVAIQLVFNMIAKIKTNLANNDETTKK